jgi:HEAT repeat protein
MRAVVFALAVLVGLQAPVAAAARAWTGAQAQAQAPAEPTDAEIAAAIAALANFDLAVRTRAARVLRRASPARVMPSLADAGRSHRSSYVRYRALALLAGLDDPASGETMRGLLADPDDRVRIIAAAWFEYRPDRSVLPALVARMADERSEYVRPALTRAIAAHLPDPRARQALLPLVERGEDFFRSAAIVALGEARASFAVDSIRAVAKFDGPLQEDAILALGRVGEKALLPELAALQRDAPPERRPAIAAAVCMLGLDCEAQYRYLVELLKFSTGDRDARMLRASARALAALASSGRREAFAPLFDVGIPAKGADRDAIALSVGLVALREPEATIAALEAVVDRPGAVRLIRDAFDLLSQEDYAQERFFRFVRQAYWQSAAGSPRRAVAEALIAGLEI